MESLEKSVMNLLSLASSAGVMVRIVCILHEVCDKEKVVLPSPNDMAIICIREVVGL